MATKVKENEEAENEREGSHDGPLLDLSDDAVKKMIKAAKKRGYVTMDELNSVLPSEEVTSEQIEDTMAMLSDMGINVVEDEEAEEATASDDDADGDSDDNESEGGEIATTSSTALATAKKKEPTDRTDDPVRMYLREMGSVELLSREGEIAIAKRIEAGRETMIAGLCESPLTFQAIIIWRDELNEGTTCFARSSISKRPIRVPRPRLRRSSRARKRSKPTARLPKRRKRPARPASPPPMTTTSPLSAAKA